MVLLIHVCAMVYLIRCAKPETFSIPTLNKDEAAYGRHQGQIPRHLHRKYCTTSCPLREGILLNVMFREEVERPNLPHHGKAQATVN